MTNLVIIWLEGETIYLSTHKVKSESRIHILCDLCPSKMAVAKYFRIYRNV